MAGTPFLERREPRTNKHHGYSPADWDELLGRARHWTREATRKNERFYVTELRSEMGIGSATARRVIEQLLSDGSIIYRGTQKLGYAALGATTSGVSLETIHGLATSRSDSEYQPPKGPRSSRRVEKISGTQLKDIETLVNLIARHAGAGDRKAVGSQWFTWDETAGKRGEGEWSLVEQVGRWSDEEHRARTLARGRTWSPCNNSMRGKVESSAKLLLDLAATAGLITRDLAHTEEYELHAAEWQPLIDEWVKQIVRRKKSKNRLLILRGCRMLALRATRRGEVGAENVDWTAIRDEIERDHSNGTLAYRPFSDVRWVYNRLRKYELIEAPAWPMKQHRRRSLVTMAVIRHSAETLDFSGWRTSSGELAEALTDGVYGAGDWVRWCRAKSDRELRAAGLPPRTWPKPTPEEQRRVERARRYNKELFKLSAGVMRARLEHVALVAGWAAEKESIDWSSEGLDRLVDPALLERLVRDLHPQDGAVDEDGDPVSSLGSQIAFTLATLASPYLEARALGEGDTELARTVRRHSDDLKALGIRLQTEKKKQISAIVSAWDAGTGRGGWARLQDLRAEMIEAIVAAAGGMSLDEQIAAINGKTFEPKMTWAVLVRDACVISFLRTIPVRVRALVEMTFGMWVNEGEPAEGAALEPWEGGIRIRFPKRLMKGLRPFAPWFFRTKHIGRPDRETDFCRSLWQLYFMAGGARVEILRYTTEEGERQTAESIYVFPALARRGGGHGTDQQERREAGLRWETGSASAQFSRRVLQFAPKLGMNTATLESLWGATSLHVIRLLFGTHWANQPGMLKPASLMLHHANSKITEAKYCAADESSVDLFQAVEAKSEVDLLREEIRRLRKKLQQAGESDDDPEVEDVGDVDLAA